MGDTRGIDIDKKNFNETIKYISNFTHLNAICFLIKPTWFLIKKRFWIKKNLVFDQKHSFLIN